MRVWYSSERNNFDHLCLGQCLAKIQTYHKLKSRKATCYATIAGLYKTKLTGFITPKVASQYKIMEGNTKRFSVVTNQNEYI